MSSLFSRKELGPSLCAARQPIVDLDGAVVGYELLFRSGSENCCSVWDRTQASSKMFDLACRYGLEVLAKGRPAFINCTRQTLLEGSIELFSSQSVVAEVLEGVAPDEAVRAACLRLKSLGYRIALDDYEPGDNREPLAGLADIVKADVQQLSAAELLQLADAFRHSSTTLLAEKVETIEEFSFARKAGFQLFQGYYIDGPELIHAPVAATVGEEPSVLVFEPEVGAAE